MEKRVLYFNGWGGGPWSKTLLTLKEELGDIVVGVTIDHTNNPLETLKTLCEAVQKAADEVGSENVIIVGNSAGGFWANYIGRVYYLNTVMINPSLKLNETIGKYGVPPEIMKVYDCLPITEANVFRDHHVFLSTEDTVVDPAYAQTIFTKITLLEGEGHVLSDMTPVINKLKEIINENIQTVY